MQPSPEQDSEQDPLETIIIYAVSPLFVIIFAMVFYYAPISTSATAIAASTGLLAYKRSQSKKLAQIEQEQAVQLKALQKVFHIKALSRSRFDVHKTLADFQTISPAQKETLFDTLANEIEKLPMNELKWRKYKILIEHLNVLNFFEKRYPMKDVLKRKINIKNFLAKVSLVEFGSYANVLEDFLNKDQLKHCLEDSSFQRRMRQKLRTVDLKTYVRGEALTQNMVFIKELSKEIFRDLYQNIKEGDLESLRRYLNGELFSFVQYEIGLHSIKKLCGKKEFIVTKDKPSFVFIKKDAASLEHKNIFEEFSKRQDVQEKLMNAFQKFGGRFILIDKSGKQRSFHEARAFIQARFGLVCLLSYDSFSEMKRFLKTKKISERVMREDAKMSVFCFEESAQHKAALLQKVCQYGHVNLVKELLTHADIQDLNTPLLLACWKNDESIVEILINDPRIDLRFDEKMFELACDHENTNILKFLLRNNQNTFDGSRLLQYVRLKTHSLEFMKRFLPLVLFYSDVPIQPFFYIKNTKLKKSKIDFIYMFRPTNNKIEPELVFAFLAAPQFNAKIDAPKKIMSRIDDWNEDWGDDDEFPDFQAARYILKDTIFEPSVMHFFVNDFPQYLKRLEYLSLATLQCLKKNLKHLTQYHAHLTWNALVPAQYHKLYARARQPYFNRELSTWFETMEQKAKPVTVAALCELVADGFLQPRALTSIGLDAAVEDQITQKPKSLFFNDDRLDSKLKNKILTCVRDNIDDRHKQASYDIELMTYERERKKLSQK